MAWDARGAINSLSQTNQWIANLKQRKKEAKQKSWMDLLGLGEDVWKTLHGAKSAEELEKLRQGGATGLEKLRQTGAIALAGKTSELRSEETEKEYGLRGGLPGKEMEALYAIWDTIWPGLSREEQYEKWAYLQGLSRPEATTSLKPEDEQYRTTAQAFAKQEVLARFAAAAKYPEETDFWSAVAQDDNLNIQVREAYRAAARNYLKDQKALNVGQQALILNDVMDYYDTWVKSGGTLDTGPDGRDVVSPPSLTDRLSGVLEDVEEPPDEQTAFLMKVEQYLQDPNSVSETDRPRILAYISSRGGDLEKEIGEREQPPAVPVEPPSHANVNPEEQATYEQLQAIKIRAQQLASAGDAEMGQVASTAAAFMENLELNPDTSWYLKPENARVGKATWIYNAQKLEDFLQKYRELSEQ